MTLSTPAYNLDTYPEVYAPREDSFLFLDALEVESEFLVNLKGTMAAEIGSGSGIIIAGLAAILQKSCAYMCTDINFEACLATKSTAHMNNVRSIECLNMDLLTCFKPNLFDVILFNPPYVETDSEEITGNGLSRAWAGGKHGREIINKLLCSLPSLMTNTGVCYMVLLKDNRLDEIVGIMGGYGFDSEIVLQRKIPGEHLFVYKFTRLCNN